MPVLGESGGSALEVVTALGTAAAIIAACIGVMATLNWPIEDCPSWASFSISPIELPSTSSPGT